ncbi:MAG: nucleotide sugar dehydrogenase, partial [Chthoniobacterales bacterium]
MINDDTQFHDLAERCKGKLVVAVQGLGFVGSAVCAAVASVVEKSGSPKYFVIGVDLPTPESFWKVEKINAGEMPFPSADASLSEVIHHAVKKQKNLVAVCDPRVYRLASVIIMDVQLDVAAYPYDGSRNITIETTGFTKAAREIGRHMCEDALVIVETTVPIGTTEHIVAPAIREERKLRGITQPALLAHCYERVMPGANYLKSIRAMSRCYSGVDAPSAEAAGAFLQSITEGSEVKHRRMASSTASEMAKLLENSYRAANIAFIHEWTLLAEKSGVNLWDVVDAIRIRKGTHDNMRYPGFGVGGYCLTKDSLLAQWGGENLLQVDTGLDTTLRALQTNYHMPLHTLDLLRELLGENLKGKSVVLCGISYLPDVGDTRNSPSQIFADAALAAGVKLTLHDPNVSLWPERPDVPFVHNLEAAIATADALVFT